MSSCYTRCPCSFCTARRGTFHEMPRHLAAFRCVSHDRWHPVTCHGRPRDMSQQVTRCFMGRCRIPRQAIMWATRCGFARCHDMSRKASWDAMTCHVGPRAGCCDTSLQLPPKFRREPVSQRKEQAKSDAVPVR